MVTHTHHTLSSPPPASTPPPFFSSLATQGRREKRKIDFVLFASTNHPCPAYLTAGNRDDTFVITNLPRPHYLNHTVSVRKEGKQKKKEKKKKRQRSHQMTFTTWQTTGLKPRHSFHKKT